MILSLAGAKLRLPFQAKQHHCSSTNLIISAFLSSLLINTSTHSPVAAGDVIDFENVLGTVIPKEASKGTTIIVVSLPETPQIQYLLATIHGNLYISHVYAVALVV
jgi:hypothetical protein